MATEKWTFEKLVDAWEAILWQSEEFQAELRRLCDVDRKARDKLINETCGAQGVVLAVLFWVSGWTEDDFNAELSRRANRKE